MLEKKAEIQPGAQRSTDHHIIVADLEPSISRTLRLCTTDFIAPGKLQKAVAIYKCDVEIDSVHKVKLTIAAEEMRTSEDVIRNLDTVCHDHSYAPVFKDSLPKSSMPACKRMNCGQEKEIMDHELNLSEKRNNQSMRALKDSKKSQNCKMK